MNQYNLNIMATNNPSILIRQMELGPLQNFLYFLGDSSKREVAVVDPAWDVDFLKAEAQKNGFRITSVFLTHGHPDHVNGLDELLSTHDVPVFLSKHEANFYTPKCKNLEKVNDGDVLEVGNIQFKCIHTPGHTPGCQCFLHENHLIAGDTLFIDGCGRCDLPGGNAKTMYASLYNIILKLPETTIIYPGHNYGPTPSDTLAGQKKTNPYLQCDSLQEFLQGRMGVSF